MDIIYQVKGKYTGLYEWGKGWVSSEAKDRWDEFWGSKMHCTYWSVCKSKDSFSSDYLVGLHGCIYNHPMDFTSYLSGDGPDSMGNSQTGFLDDLYKVCSEAAEYCGGGFKFYVGKVDDVKGDRTVAYTPKRR